MDILKRNCIDLLRSSWQKETFYVCTATECLDLVEILKVSLDSGLLPFQAVLLEGFLGDCLHVLFVENLECLGIAKTEDFLSEELHAEGVDGADEIAGVFPADEAVDTVAHLCCSLVGECKTEDIARIDAKHINKVSVPVCEHACLARAGSGDYSYSAFSSFHSL